MPDNFKRVEVLDNYYQTSSYYPMPVVLMTTLSKEGITNIGPYSLCFPFGIAEKHYMMLISRSDSNTAKNIRRTGIAAINFIPFDNKLLANTVRLGYPGQTAQEKLKDSLYTLIPSLRESKDKEYPDIIKEAVQVMECTWDDDPDIFHYKGSSGESHFLLSIDAIFMKERWYDALISGNGKFPSLPIDYGYRDSKFFWFAKHKKPFKEPIPQDKGVDINTVKYQVQRLPYDIEWEDEACERLVKVPRIFLKRVLDAISKKALEDGIKIITPELLEEYNKKRR